MRECGEDFTETVASIDNPAFRQGPWRAMTKRTGNVPERRQGEIQDWISEGRTGKGMTVSRKRNTVQNDTVVLPAISIPMQRKKEE